MFLASLFDRMILNVIVLVVIAAIILFLTRRAYKGHNDLRDKFFKEEMESNHARARDVEPEYFYEADTSALPTTPSAERDIAIKCSKLTMVRFPKKMTNIELKSNYGVSNLEKITGYEENYTRYISTLVTWAEALLEKGQDSDRTDAITILETAVGLGSEFRKSYIYLADYYFEQKNVERLDYLMDRAAEMFMDAGIRMQLTKYIMDKKEEL